MIKGYFDDRNRPWLDAQVDIPELGVTGRVSFLAKTGAKMTCLKPGDGNTLQIPFDNIRTEGQSYLETHGWQVKYHPLRATITFDGDNGPHTMEIDLHVAKPDQMGLDRPSILGWDIISQWRMIYDPMNNRMEFETEPCRETKQEDTATP